MGKTEKKPRKTLQQQHGKSKLELGRRKSSAPLTTDAFYLFWGKFASQWHKCTFVIDDQEYSSAEQYMMAEKARLFGDDDMCRQILATRDTKKQKQLGRKVRGFNIDLWNAACEDIVYKGNLAKFQQNPKLLAKLKATGSREIAEASPKDTIWGIGLSADDPRAQDREKWKGKNLLGKALMRVRSELCN